jgi:glutamate-1-semialdehyde 2,1-aminomutase
VRACVTHVGSLVNVHFADPPLLHAEAATPVDPVAVQAFHLGLMNRGIVIAPRGLFALSLVTTREDVDRAVGASGELFRELAAAGIQRLEGGGHG